MQETFVKVYATLLNYSNERIQALKLRPWVYKITLNVFRHHIRSQVQILPLDLSYEHHHLSLKGNDTDQPEPIFEEQETWLEIEDLVAQLPTRYRVAIVCYYFEHLSYQETAEQFDQPQGTVKSTISRGVRLLRAACTRRAAGNENLPWKNNNQKKHRA